MLRKNDIYNVEIYGYTHDGAGIAKIDDAVVFIPGGAAGDKLQIRIIKVLSNRAIGKIGKIIEPSSDRGENDCPAFPACGGCDFRHISYEAELKQKKGVVAGALSKIGGMPVSPEDFEIVPAPAVFAYRNKAVFPIGKDRDGRIIYGFYRTGSHNIVECRPGCLIHPGFFSEAARAVVSYMEKTGVPPYDEKTGSGVVRAVYIRYGEISGEVMVCVISAKPSLPRSGLPLDMLKASVPCLKTVVLNVNAKRTNVLLGNENIVLYGGGHISDTLCQIRLELSPHSFYQVNRAQCEALYARVLEYSLACGDIAQKCALDLFCGVGSITLMLARRFKKVLGIEIEPAAVENAAQNARQNGIENASFFCADALKAPEILRRQGFVPDIVIVDPPRSGLSPEVCDFLIKSEARHLIYVSCEPSTLARDIKTLGTGGFELKKQRYMMTG